LPNLTFISLQKHPSRSNDSKLIDWTSELHDFADTAGLIANLDLVITVDTAVAHLAGALGNPVWVLVPFVPDWRWMLDRNDSPWYPTMRLFRQPHLGDWGAVVSEVVQALQSHKIERR
jgi:ADP-heptose:LPS heptosyltransferase